MPWCEEENCGKRSLKKDEVVFDDLRQRVLCVPCGQKVAEVTKNEALHGEVADKTWFGVGYTSDEGLHAELVHGGAKLALKVSNDQVMKILGT